MGFISARHLQIGKNSITYASSRVSQILYSKVNLFKIALFICSHLLFNNWSLLGTCWSSTLSQILMSELNYMLDLWNQSGIIYGMHLLIFLFLYFTIVKNPEWAFCPHLHPDSSHKCLSASHVMLRIIIKVCSCTNFIYY